MSKIFIFVSFLFLSACGSFRPDAPIRQNDFFRMSWAKNLDPSYESGNLPIGNGAPRIFNEIVYMGDLKGVMHAIDLESGRVLWSHEEKTALGAPAEFFNNHVAYGGLNGRLFVRHYLTGQLKYAIDLGAPIESAPFYDKGRLLIYLRGHQLVHIDAETGKILWAYTRAVPITTTLQRTSRPLIVGNKIIVGFADGYVGALSREEGLLVWETKIADQGKFVDVDLNPLLVGGVIITGSPSGELKALNPENGAIARSFGVTVQAHPVLKGEQLILGTTEGEVILMSLAGETLKKIKVSKQAVSAVGWWKGNLIAATFDGKLLSIDPLSQKIVDEFYMGRDYSAVFSDLVIQDHFLAVYSSRNRLYMFH